MGVAVVTGGGRGIGAAISLRLARDGHAVAVNYARGRAEAEAVVAEIESAGGRAVAIGADIGRPDEAASLIEQAGELLGTPTILVNNAGVNHSGSARRQPPEEFDRVLAVNLHGAYYCTHAALGGMYEAGRGRVVFFGSPSGGRDIVPTMGAYAAAKAGLVALAKVLAKEAARRGVTVNTVIPGFVETDMVRSAGDRALANLKETWPQVPAEAVASTVSFLTSDEAAYISGEEIGVWLGGPVSA